MRLLLSLLTCLVALTGCSADDLPKSSADASAKVDSFKATMTAFGEKVAPAVDATKSTLTHVGEATESGVDTAKDTLETVGTVTRAGVHATKTGLEAVGNTVIRIRDGNAPKNNQPPAQQQ